MGKSFYRKYRSKTLDDVVGQSHVTDTLKNAIKKQAISHAYLFTGPHGVGKTSVARLLAHAINDLEYDDESTHLDIIEIDAASNRRIDEIRELRDKVHVAPTSSKYKVYIIDEVHMLTREAFNALLKTLEEPPAHAVFILATTEAHKVPDTIISRTQRFMFKPIAHDDAKAHLKHIATAEGITIDDKALDLLVHHGNGSFRDSISMLDQLAGMGSKKLSTSDVSMLLGVPDDTLIQAIVTSLSKNDAAGLFDTIEQLRGKGSHPSIIAQSIISKLRQQIMTDDLTLDGETAVQTMQQLLGLTATQASYEALEIVLLSALSLTANEQSQPKTPDTVSEEPVFTPSQVSQESHETPKATNEQQLAETVEQELEPVQSQPESEPEPQPESDAEPEVPQSQPHSEPNAGWQTVLTELKKQHNTLYGVLRMAHVDETPDELILTFQFGFHKKQLDQPKNISIVNGLVQKHISPEHKVTLQVKAGDKKPEQKQKLAIEKPPAKNDQDLANISNIFGGAELLD